MTTPDTDPTANPDFSPTHVVPPNGLAAWETPDPSRPTVCLDALLPVRLVDRRGDWGRVVCANGWSAWVDGRLLVAVPRPPPAATAPLSRTADPDPLLARAEEALTGYRAAVEDLAAGRLDGESFRARTRGQRIGVVVDGECVWLYDAEHERWTYSDGTRLGTFAVGTQPATEDRRRTGAVPVGAGHSEPAGPAGEPDGHAPTRLVTPPVTEEPEEP